MKIEIITGRSPLFEDAANTIVTLYNQSTVDSVWPNQETLNIQNPDMLFVARPVGVRGGIIVDRFKDIPHIADIMFAAFEEKDQRQGYLRQCIQKSNKYLKKHQSVITSASLNPNDNQDPWRALGFVHEGMVNFVMRLQTLPSSELYPASTQRDGIGLEDLQKVLGASLFN